MYLFPVKNEIFQHFVQVRALGTRPEFLLLVDFSTYKEHTFNLKDLLCICVAIYAFKVHYMNVSVTASSQY